MEVLIEPKTRKLAPEDERRHEHRLKALKGATIRFNKGYGALHCVIRDLTEDGALLVFGDTTGVPSVFDIEIAGSDQKKRARVRWRRPDKVGIVFE